MPFILKPNEWDTTFFGFKVGTIISHSHCEIENLLDVIKECINQRYKLLYIFEDSIISESSLLFSNYNIQLVDIKLVFILTKLQRKEFSPCVYEYVGEPHLLYSLALQAGQFSRFNLDKNFKEGEFERLYSVWIEKSLNNQLADKVYVCELDNNLVGFVTVKLHDDTLTISLIATDEKYRKRGVGTMLFNHVLNFAIDSGMSKIEVSTQYHNQSACSFYKSHGMCELSKTFIYHLWIK